MRQCLCGRSSPAAREEVDAPTTPGGEAVHDYEDLSALVRILVRKGKPVRLVKPEYFISLYHETDEPMPCRQDLPEEAFLSIDVLSKEERADLTIIAISYCWLSKEHPDPKRYHLMLLATLLEVYIRSSPGNAKRECCVGRHLWGSGSPPALGFDMGGLARPVGIFLDWTSLYQGRNRSAEQGELFREALREIDIWYAHRETTVWIFSALPEDSTRALYDQSGWPSFERAAASVIKPGPKLLNIDLAARSKLQEMITWSGHYLDVVFAFMDTTRSAPLVPEAFNRFIQGKTFTNGADRDTVVRPLYARTFAAVVRNSDSLSLVNSGISGVEALKAARVAAEHSRRLRRVVLAGNGQMELQLGDLLAALDLKPASWRRRLRERPVAAEVAELSLQGCRRIGGDFSALAPLSRLRELNLRNCCGVGGQLSTLACFKELRLLSIGARPDDDSIGIGIPCESVQGQLSALAPLTKLMHLSLDNSKVEGQLSDLTPLVELRHLGLKGSIGGQLASLAPLAKLRHLSLIRCSDVHGQLSALAPLGALRHLELEGCWGIQGQFSDLDPFADLTHLGLCGCQGVQGRLSALACLTELRYLDLRDCQDVQGQLSDLAHLKALRHLGLCGCESVRGQLSDLAPLTALMHLNLEGCQGVQGQLSALAPLAELRHLELGLCEGVQGLLWELVPLTALQVLSLRGADGVRRVEGDSDFLESRGCHLRL